LESGNLGSWKSGSLEIWKSANDFNLEICNPQNKNTKVIRTKICHAQNAGSVLITQEKNFLAPLGTIFDIFPMGRQISQFADFLTFCLFSLVGQCAAPAAIHPWWASGRNTCCNGDAPEQAEDNLTEAVEAPGTAAANDTTEAGSGSDLGRKI
jgi:hypothetical protein